MFCSIEVPPEKPRLRDSTRSVWAMLILIAIVALAVYFAVAFGDVAGAVGCQAPR